MLIDKTPKILIEEEAITDKIPMRRNIVAGGNKR
jgi:hypothetical protein